MAAIGAYILAADLSPVFRRELTSSTGEFRLKPSARLAARESTISIAAAASAAAFCSAPEDVGNRYAKGLEDYFEEARDLIGSNGGGGPPRWFSPLECGAGSRNSPLLLFLPGIDGVGLGLIRQHQKLGMMFDIWCLHIPPKDRTVFKDLVEMVVKAVRSEYHQSPDRPIYLVGESLGACIALAVAASIPDVDLMLVLSNPATSFGNSPLQTLLHLSKVLPDKLHLTIPYMLRLLSGDPLKKLIGNWVEGLPMKHTVGRLYQDLVRTTTYKAVLAELLPTETLFWKLELIDVASKFVNAHLHLVQAQTLILSSERDHFLPSKIEGKRLRHILRRCEIRNFKGSDHFLFLEDGIDLVSIIKGAYFYRRGKHSNCISDYTPATSCEFNTYFSLNRLFEIVMGTVFLSTREDGEIVQGLGGIPSEGPVLIVGNHMLLACDSVSLPGRFFAERNMTVRTISHPLMFSRLRDGCLPDISKFDKLRIMGIVPVSGNNLYNLLSSKSRVLMYPGGVREALHRKGEEYKLMWPENPEFVRMAAKFGAKIIPFGGVGEDDVFKEFFDYNDQIKIPYLKSLIESITDEAESLRPVGGAEEGNQALYLPVVIPKFPGRFYFYFGKPIDTKGREDVLNDKGKSRELYMEVKSEVERCMEFLKKKREHDPYRSLWSRLEYQLAHGLESEVPTFEF